MAFVFEMFLLDYLEKHRMFTSILQADFLRQQEDEINKIHQWKWRRRLLFHCWHWLPRRNADLNLFQHLPHLIWHP